MPVGFTGCMYVRWAPAAVGKDSHHRNRYASLHVQDPSGDGHGAVLNQFTAAVHFPPCEPNRSHYPQLGVF